MNHFYVLHPRLAGSKFVEIAVQKIPFLGFFLGSIFSGASKQSKSQLKQGGVREAAISRIAQGDGEKVELVFCKRN
jgi:hypothetical protein